MDPSLPDPREIVYEWARLWSAHDVKGLLALFTEDASYQDLALGHSVQGHKELEEFVRGTFKTFPDFRIEIRRAVGDQTTAVGEWEMSGTFNGESFGQAPTGKQFRVPGCCVMHLDNGRISTHRDYWNEPTFDRQVKADPSEAQ
ncbi:ester cyclase [Paraburkholderia nemoris]|uniref:ester cyclase n=1 Tax=Paraburkholderia nemoris TaxID=2793076 RepID=UPI0038B6EC72